MKKKLWIIIPAAAAVVLLAAFLILLRINKYDLIINDGKATVRIEYGEEMPKISARYKGTIFNRKGTKVQVTQKGEVDLKTLGTYKVTFLAKHKNLSLKKVITFIVQDTTPPVIELVSNPNTFTSPVGPYIEEGYKATDNYDGDITDKVISEQKGEEVIYTVSDSSGNKAKKIRSLAIKDVVPPVITLSGGADLAINIGKAFADPGYTATDDVDGDLTASVEVSGKVDGLTYGTYKLTYKVKDKAGNETEIVRNVKVADIEAPVITLNGPVSTFIKVGTPYSDPGFSATDNIDGNITSKVSVTGGVNANQMGYYTITYTAKDNYGNVGTAVRSVYVYDKQAVANPVNPGNKVVYLTFDDGPSRYTATLLDTLDMFGVKATFFVTNQFPAYQHMIGEEYRRGHSIALHTYSHSYQQIYTSEYAYYDDLQKIHNIVVAQTGKAPSIVRFPGGTSNTVSRKYCRGIMTTLSQSISYHGYLSCDWNVSSGDAGGLNDATSIANNVINGMKTHNVSIVLQHDIKAASVEAVKQILFWGIQNGYTFLPMSETTPMTQFRPAN